MDVVGSSALEKPFFGMKRLWLPMSGFGCSGHQRGNGSCHRCQVYGVQMIAIGDVPGLAIRFLLRTMCELEFRHHARIRCVTADARKFDEGLPTGHQ